MATHNNSSNGMNRSFVPVILIDEPTTQNGETPSKNIRLDPVNAESDAWEIARQTCRSMPDAIGFTVSEVHHG